MHPALFNLPLRCKPAVIINISGDISRSKQTKQQAMFRNWLRMMHITFGAMYDENAQDEASITVIATGLDEHNATSSVSKAMTGFSSNNFKTQWFRRRQLPQKQQQLKLQLQLLQSRPSLHLTAPLILVQLHSQPIQFLSLQAQEALIQVLQTPRKHQNRQLRHRREPPLPSARQQTKKCQINIPDFLKNKNKILNHQM